MLKKLQKSPVSTHFFAEKTFYLKRDDLLHPLFSGNKARKFSQLLAHDFHQIDTLVGYGSPQANSLYSLAALAHIKHVPLLFYVQRIPMWLKQNPIGNYLAALNLGAQVIDLSDAALNPSHLHPSQFIEQHFHHNNRALCIPEGGRSPIAKSGIDALGEELIDWIVEQKIDHPVVALPSGTGTTALYLQHYLRPHNIEVLTCACVGGAAYLIEQFKELNGVDYPTILSARPKHHFGQLYLDDYLIWQRLKQETLVEFDLLYDPLMWLALIPWLQQNLDKTLIYIHQGGLLGNESMAKRYIRKYASTEQHRCTQKESVHHDKQ
jgi:1-aminocyclopropane-1-carboxylate deaminase/D-cysteine desulfhydrase-like pyridoxal-dependent ACC family enzyme